jgi:hypothetical protein
MTASGTAAVRSTGLYGGDEQGDDSDRLAAVRDSPVATTNVVVSRAVWLACRAASLDSGTQADEV